MKNEVTEIIVLWGAILTIIAVPWIGFVCYRNRLRISSFVHLLLAFFSLFAAIAITALILLHFDDIVRPFYDYAGFEGSKILGIIAAIPTLPLVLLTGWLFYRAFNPKRSPISERLKLDTPSPKHDAAGVSPDES